MARYRRPTMLFSLHDPDGSHFYPARRIYEDSLNGGVGC